MFFIRNSHDDEQKFFKTKAKKQKFEKFITVLIEFCKLKQEKKTNDDFSFFSFRYFVNRQS